jgi:cobalt-zinc-cadmium resistance protein CzcA
MINRIIEFSLHQRVFVMIGAVVLIAAGVWSATRLPIDAVPDITNVQVQINTVVPALSPEEVERQVTFPIETEMAGLQGLEEIRSLSKFGLSQLTMVFSEDTDIYRARQLVSERLVNVGNDLPAGTQPRLAPISTGLGEVYFYTVDYEPGATNKPASRYEQLLELRTIQDWVLRPAMRSVPGVADVETFGGYEKQIVVQPDPQKLFSAGLSFEELAQVLRENMRNVGGGLINKGGEQISVRTVGRVQSLDEIAELPIKFGAGVQPLLVKDVAGVKIGSSFRAGAATANGEEAILAYALMLTGENSRVVAQRAHAKLQELQAKMPPGIKLEPVYNRSELVNRTITTVRNNLFEGAILVIAVLFVLLGNWRAALIVAAAIPLSMLFAVTGMVRAGVSGNLMSLGAIDFGLIVDGAVVIAENAVRMVGQRQQQLRRLLTGEERRETILESCRQVGQPMVFGVAIITIVYVPILALTGTEGKMFKPMAFTVIFALIGSLLLALTLVPVLCSWFLSRGVAEEDNRVMRWVKRIYEPLLRWGLAHCAALVSISVLLFAGATFIFSRLGAEFVPQLDEGSVIIQMVRPTSISLDESLAMQIRAEKVIRQEFPEIAGVFSRIGTPEIGTDPMGANLSDTFVFFAPEKQWRQVNGRRTTKDELIDSITKTLRARVPGQDYLFTQPIEMRFNEMMEGARSDIAVKIYGEEFSILQRIAGEANALLEKIPGTSEIEMDSDNLGFAPVLDIRPNREAMRRFNLHAEEINQTISAALGGLPVGNFIEGNRRFEIVVRMSEENRGRLDELGRLPVRAGANGLIPLGKVTTHSVRDQVNMIEREGGQRRVGIEVNLRGRDIQSWVNEAKEKLKAIDVPQGYAIEFGGQFKQLLRARERLAYIVPVALLLIFMLIFAAFGSARQAALVFVCVPLAITGGVVALWAREMPFSISAAIGFIALSGIAVLNGIMLISFINQLRAEGRPLHDAVLAGSLTRLRPKLMTALVASLGFVPMALATGAGAEVQRPLATVVIGGIISSTFLTLVLLPTLYEWIERRRENKMLRPNPASAEPPTVT